MGASWQSLICKKRTGLSQYTQLTKQSWVFTGKQLYTYIDQALPFGLRSAPKLFSALTDGFMWCLHNKGIQFGLHYLDDFLLLGPAGSRTCHDALAAALTLCDHVGLLVAPDKTEGPSTCLIFLGIELDTSRGHLRLPHDKKERLLAAITKWTGGRSPRRSGTKHDLLSLIGLLNHAAKVVRPGRAFIRSLIDASTQVSSLEHHVHLNSAASRICAGGMPSCIIGMALA